MNNIDEELNENRITAVEDWTKNTLELIISLSDINNVLIVGRYVNFYRHIYSYTHLFKFKYKYIYFNLLTL